MSYRFEDEIIHLGAEAYVVDVRGQPEAFWVSRPRRRSPSRLVFAVVLVLALSFGALYAIGQVPGLAYSPLAFAFQP